MNCTVVVSASGALCGKPAVSSFTARDGSRFAECALHDTSAKVAPRKVTHPFEPKPYSKRGTICRICGVHIDRHTI